MKKQFTLLLCCLTLAVSMVAQPASASFYEKNAKKKVHERVDHKRNIEKRSSKADFEKVKQFLPQKPNSQTKNTDWWEPDTINLYVLSGMNARYLFSYSKGNCISKLYQLFEYGEWINYFKNNYSYNTQNKLSECVTQFWESNQWMNDSKDSYTYNAQNFLTEEIYQSWESNQWENSWKMTYTYDAQNDLTELLYSDWDDNQWVVDARYTISYYEQNTKVELLFQGWENGQWINYDKDTYTYDVQKNLIELLEQEWENNQWESYWKENYSYNAQNNITEQLNQYWDDELNQWEKAYRLVYKYDAQNNMTEWLVQDWWDEWMNAQKNSYTYDAQNNRTSETIELWDWDISQWENEEKTNYTYDENNNAVFGFSQAWANNTWVDGYGDYTIFYNNMQSVFEEHRFHKFTASYVKPAEVSIKENKIENIVRVYPNPTTGVLQVTSDERQVTNVEVFDIYGRKHNHQIISSSNHLINISHLPAGIYFLQAAEQTVKVVKQ